MVGNELCDFKMELMKWEYFELDSRLRFVSERSYNEEMKKYSIRGKLFAIVGKNINNRLAVFSW